MSIGIEKRQNISKKHYAIIIIIIINIIIIKLLLLFILIIIKFYYYFYYFNSFVIILIQYRFPHFLYNIHVTRDNGENFHIKWPPQKQVIYIEMSYVSCVCYWLKQFENSEMK